MFDLEYFQLTMSLPGDDRIISTRSPYMHGFISGFSIILDCMSNYCSFVMLTYFEVKKYDTSSFVILSQDCLDYLEFFEIL